VEAGLGDHVIKPVGRPQLEGLLAELPQLEPFGAGLTT
jgi:hypothetical protein